MTLSSLKRELKKASDREYAVTAGRFFKTGKGEYGEGDIFLGIRVPKTREIVKKYKTLSLEDAEELLSSKYHEERMAALLLLVEKFKKGAESEKQEIYDFYIKSAKKVNNWDLVDLSAPEIVGGFLLKRGRDILYRLAKSENIWERRISIVATHAFIKNNDLATTFEISDILLKDDHDLIQKATGWMIREAGKRELTAEEEFLKTRYKVMPRTMLRYAIEKFPKERQREYLEGRI